MPAWLDLLLSREQDGFVFEGLGRKDTPRAKDDGDHEERPREVAQKGEQPVKEHARERQPPVEHGNGGVLRVAVVSMGSLWWVSRRRTMKLPVHKSVPVRTISTRLVNVSMDPRN